MTGAWMGNNLLAYVYPPHMFCSNMGVQKGPLSGVVPLISQAVSSFDGIPKPLALSAACFAGSVYFEVVDVEEDDEVVSAVVWLGVLVTFLVALTPGAM